MVKKNRKSNKKKWLALSILCLLIIAGGIFGYRHYHKNDQQSSNTVRQPNSISYAPSKPIDNVPNNERKSASKTGSSVATTLNTPSTAPSFSVTVSRANVSDQDIDVAANVNGVTSGSCVFNFSSSSGGQPIISSQTEQVVESNQSASCPPENVQMPNNGNWYVSVSVTNSGSTATAQWAKNPILVGP